MTDWEYALNEGLGYIAVNVIDGQEGSDQYVFDFSLNLQSEMYAYFPPGGQNLRVQDSGNQANIYQILFNG